VLNLGGNLGRECYAWGSPVRLSAPYGEGDLHDDVDSSRTLAKAALRPGVALSCRALSGAWT